jgi:hypothetical protein
VASGGTAISLNSFSLNLPLLDGKKGNLQNEKCRILSQKGFLQGVGHKCWGGGGGGGGGGVAVPPLAIPSIFLFFIFRFKF